MRTRRPNAFTLIELIMAIALIGLLAAAIVGPDESAFSGIGDEPLDETLRKAVREARYKAVRNGDRVTLMWNAESSSFVFLDPIGQELDRMATDVRLENDGVQFMLIQQIEGSDIPDKDPVLVATNTIVFDADRAATPFIAKIHYAGEETEVRCDAFSNLKIEEEKKK